MTVLRTYSHRVILGELVPSKSPGGVPGVEFMVILGKPSHSWSQTVFQLDKCLMVIKIAVGSVNPLTQHENKVWLRQKHGSRLIVVRSEMKGLDLLSGFSEWKEVASCCMKCTNLWHWLVLSKKSWLSLSVSVSDLPHAPMSLFSLFVDLKALCTRA